MADRFSKRPTLGRFKFKKTHGSRVVRKSTLVRRNVKSSNKGRKPRKMRSVRNK